MAAARRREKLSVSKRAAQKFDMQRFDLRKLNNAEVKEQYGVKISNRFAALENLDDNVDINRAWENTKGKFKIPAKEGLGHYELTQNKPWFEEECSKLLHKRKQDKLQWLQNCSQMKIICSSEAEIVIEKSKRYKSPGIDQIPAQDPQMY
jgi:hypothetical protein